jgi:hypothetical protein
LLVKQEFMSHNRRRYNAIGSGGNMIPLLQFHDVSIWDAIIVDTSRTSLLKKLPFEQIL